MSEIDIHGDPWDLKAIFVAGVRIQLDSSVDRPELIEKLNGKLNGGSS